jgi:hypothetical protein
MDADEGQGWSREYVERMEVAYKRFLTLLVTHPETPIAPSKDIDKFWHGHILDTMKYAEDCQNVFGYFLHHFPYFGMRGEQDAAALSEAGDAMQRLYREQFGEDMPGREASAAYCFAAKKADAAYCFAATKGEAAYCFAAKGTDAAYCFAAKPVNAAYCFAAKPAYCFAAKAETPAYCFAAKPSYCFAAQGKDAAAYCFAAQGADQSAYCFASGQAGKVDVQTRPTLALAA